MAWQVGSACYGSEVAAAQAVSSGLVGSIVQQGSVAYVVASAEATSATITYDMTPVDGGQALTITSPFTPQPCNLLQLSDGLELGWMVGGVWIAVCALLFMARGLHGAGGGYGSDA